MCTLFRASPPSVGFANLSAEEKGMWDVVFNKLLPSILIHKHSALSYAATTSAELRIVPLLSSSAIYSVVVMVVITTLSGLFIF
jgi:hypothetical protein